MSRFTVASLSALCVGAVAAALLLSDAPISQSLPLRAVSVPAKTLAARVVQAIHDGVVLPLAAAVRTLVPSIAGTESRPEFVLLSKPLIVARESDGARTTLPRNTRVRLLSSDGRFLRVQHAHDTLTIPRTATVAGASATYF